MTRWRDAAPARVATPEPGLRCWTVRVPSIALLLAFAAASPGCADTAAPEAGRDSARVVEVIDGDTIRVLVGGEERSVRLIGIDTPETRRPGSPVECGGPEATRHLERLAPPGRAVTLVGDPTQDREDRYGRLLAYVDDLAERQLAAGFARVYVYERPFRRLSRFRAAERSARRASRGAWAACGHRF